MSVIKMFPTGVKCILGIRRTGSCVLYRAEGCIFDSVLFAYIYMYLSQICNSSVKEKGQKSTTEGK